MRKTLLAAGCAAMLASTPLLLAQKGDAAKGKGVFEDNCAVCHAVDSTEKKAPIGPGLKGLFKKDKLNNGKKPTDATIRALINAGGNGMPSFSDTLSDAERDNVVAYLKTL